MGYRKGFFTWQNYWSLTANYKLRTTLPWHELYRFIMGDLMDCWEDTKAFPPARKSGWADDPKVKSYPHLDEIIKAQHNGVLLPEPPVFNELADIVHQAIQRERSTMPISRKPWTKQRPR